MNIAVFGTGMVGKTIAGKLSELGHDIKIGTRDVNKTLARTEPDTFGNPPISEWLKDHQKVQLTAFAKAAAHGELIINATSGTASLSALESAGEDNLKDKVLIDIANPLDFSKGMPPILTVCNDNSLGEQIQKAFPSVKVVKTLNTTNAQVMINPAQVGNGDHHMFICGNDAGAKAKVSGYLKEWFGWKHIIDLGDISNARGTEMLLPIWVRLYGALQTPMFNFKIVQ
ncbi:MAG: NAD(P)-binding domain-containing protein [Calditrichia bacterium]